MDVIGGACGEEVLIGETWRDHFRFRVQAVGERVGLCVGRPDVDVAIHVRGSTSELAERRTCGQCECGGGVDELAAREEGSFHAMDVSGEAARVFKEEA